MIDRSETFDSGQLYPFTKVNEANDSSVWVPVLKLT